jgi:sulfur carrier protein
MILIINGERYTFEEDMSIKEMLESFELKSSRIVVELNKKIVSKNDHETTFLRDGDVIEVVQFVGGG